MDYILTNIRPILAATLAGLLVGALYLWAGLGGGAPVTAGFVLTAVVAEFWLTSILAGAVILAPPQAGPWTMAVGSAVVIWIGFVLPAQLVAELSRGVGYGAALLDCAQWLVAMGVQAAVLQGVGLIKPEGAGQRPDQGAKG